MSAVPDADKAAQGEPKRLVDRLEDMRDNAAVRRALKAYRAGKLQTVSMDEVLAKPK